MRFKLWPHINYSCVFHLCQTSLLMPHFLSHIMIICEVIVIKTATQHKSTNWSTNKKQNRLNHRIAKVGKDPQDHPVQPFALHQWFPLNHVPQHNIQTLFEHHQGRWLHHLSGQPIPVPDQPFHPLMWLLLLLNGNVLWKVPWCDEMESK